MSQAVNRSIVVLLWAGARIVRRLGPGDPDPTPAELDAIAVAHTAWNDDCVRPVVRVLEQSSLPGRSLGPAGSVVQPPAPR